MNTPRRKMRWRLFLISLLFLALLIFSIFIGVQIYHSNQNAQIKKVIGIDVSAYQGDIDWKEIEEQGIYFAYIKATESNDFKDKKFDQNWKNINRTNILKGAYLFYDFSKDGNLMADFFIKTVPDEYKTLPPAIDIELTSQDTKSIPSEKSVIANVNKIVTKLREHYKQDPIIYTNIKTYKTYFMKNKIENTKLWICDISNSDPEIEGADWTFWQYSWRGMLNGINSDEKFVDLDCYNGNLQEFYKEYEPSIFSY